MVYDNAVRIGTNNNLFGVGKLLKQAVFTNVYKDSVRTSATSSYLLVATVVSFAFPANISRYVRWNMCRLFSCFAL